MKTKLVRDRIPSLFEAEGKPYHVEELKNLYGSRFKEVIANKIREEADEVAEALLEGNVEHLLEELVDLHDVLNLLNSELALTPDEFIRARAVKWEAKGGFSKGYVITYG